MLAWISYMVGLNFTSKDISLAMAYKAAANQSLRKFDLCPFSQYLLLRGVYTRVLSDTRADN